jgi:hypothetical protein
MDYSRTCSLVVKRATIHVVLSLYELVYRHQSSRFVDSYFPNHVCRLQYPFIGSNKLLINGFIVFEVLYFTWPCYF